MDPEERFRIDRRPSSSPSSGVRDHGLRLRPDLCPTGPPMTKDDALAAKRELVARLSEEGYTVNGDRTVWRVYVIELSDDVGPRATPTLPWVYVGQTSNTPEERFRQHRDGARNAKGAISSKWPHRLRGPAPPRPLRTGVSAATRTPTRSLRKRRWPSGWRPTATR